MNPTGYIPSLVDPPPRYKKPNNEYYLNEIVWENEALEMLGRAKLVKEVNR